MRERGQSNFGTVFLIVVAIVIVFTLQLNALLSMF